MNNADKAAYPGSVNKGLTKREQFAMHFMASWITHHGNRSSAQGAYSYSSKRAADSALEDADALLKALEATK